MRTIEDVTKCTGCLACDPICPQKCIYIETDNEGFLVPKIDKAKCLSCGICYEKCPQVNDVKRNTVNKAYAMQTTDKDLLLKSSSGGAFGSISKGFLDNDGVVIGCTLDSCEMTAKHIAITEYAELNKLHGSKYLQSDVKGIYTSVKNYLENKKRVLFSGTPCQVAGLKSFLGKEYSNLYTIDLICHGVPSQWLFHQYLSYLMTKYKTKIIEYSFRNKNRIGCSKNATIKSGHKEKRVIAQCDLYLTAFEKSLTLRECCYECKYANTNRVADITIGDYWGVQQYHGEFKVETGVSLLIINNEHGEKLINNLSGVMHLVETKIEWAKQKNGNLSSPTMRPVGRNTIYQDVKDNGFKIMEKYVRVKPTIFNLIYLLIPSVLLWKIKKVKNMSNNLFFSP